MWEMFNTDLLVTGERQVLGLAHPQSNIVKHVQCLNIKTRIAPSDADDQLPMLLAALPRGQLRGFESNSGVSTAALKLLLRLHPAIEHLRIPAVEIKNLVGCPWVPQRLPYISRMKVYLQHTTHEQVRDIWDRCSGLQDASLMGSAYGSATYTLHEEHFLLDGTSDTKDGTDKCASPQLQLKSLHLGDIGLPKTFVTMFRRINPLLINKLTLDGTTGIEKLLEALAAEFEKGQPQLQYLHIVNQAAQTTDDLNCGRIDVDGIVNHGETLTSLLVVDDTADLEKIAIACPRLQQFCLNLYELDSDRPENDIIERDPSSGGDQPTESEQALRAVASIGSLEVLWLTNPPNYRKSFRTPGHLWGYFRRQLETGEQRYALQARANGLMRYLAAHGSNIAVLALSPTEKLTEATSPDKNGHFWPNYYYGRGSVVDYKGHSAAVAIPMADWNAEASYAIVLKET
ncbi:hypothetical protein NX059_001410 [Plenodomus lindquistii]|nr:hypothetical protein NX059_001410 [Plenodomus lindquistii]